MIQVLYSILSESNPRTFGLFCKNISLYLILLRWEGFQYHHYCRISFARAFISCEYICICIWSHCGALYHGLSILASSPIHRTHQSTLSAGMEEEAGLPFFIFRKFYEIKRLVFIFGIFLWNQKACFHFWKFLWNQKAGFHFWNFLWNQKAGLPFII